MVPMAPVLMTGFLVAASGLSTSQYGQVGIAILVAALAYVERRWHRETKARQEEIHVLVNSRLTEALDEIVALKNRLDSKDKVISDQEAVAKEIRDKAVTATLGT